MGIKGLSEVFSSVCKFSVRQLHMIMEFNSFSLSVVETKLSQAVVHVTLYMYTVPALVFVKNN